MQRARKKTKHFIYHKLELEPMSQLSGCAISQAHVTVSNVSKAAPKGRNLHHFYNTT